MINFRAKAHFDQEATVVFISKNYLERGAFHNLGPVLTKELQRLRQQKKFCAEAEELFPLLSEKTFFVLAGTGSLSDQSATSLRMVARKAFLCSYLKKSRSLEVLFDAPDENLCLNVLEGLLVGCYSWSRYLSGNKQERPPLEKHVVLSTNATERIKRALVTCEGVNLARDLINENADVTTSEFIEQKILELVKGRKEVFLEILNQKELKKQGLHLHLAVNQGSPKEPKLIVARYQGAEKSKGYTALVGKGITFDTGGLNLKPTGSIETMRSDMSGAAAVVGALKNVLSLKFKNNILFVVALAENAIGAKAYKPGDVLRSYNGKTVEIGNTDAEGRLVLADAISYVVRNYKPARLIDLATLTGACVVALGYDYSGLMSNDDLLAANLLTSAAATDDRIWRMPLYPELKEQIKSPIADIKNVGLPKGAGGTISAAEFLRQFVEDTPWAHLDIAGTAFVNGPSRLYFGPGATGAGVRLLTHYLGACH